MEEGKTTQRDDRGIDRRDLLRSGRLSPRRPQGRSRRCLRRETREEPRETSQLRRSFQEEAGDLVPQTAVITPPVRTLFPTWLKPRLSMTSRSSSSHLLSRMISGSLVRVNSSSLEASLEIAAKILKTP